jgi:hypothetical protein
MRKRRLLQAVGVSFVGGVAGCLTSDTEKQDGQTEEITDESNETSPSPETNGSPEGDPTRDTTQSHTGTVTVQIDARGAIELVDRMQVTIGGVFLTPVDGEQITHSVLDVFDLTDAPVSILEPTATPAGQYTEMTLTATVNERTLTTGETPQVLADRPTATLGTMSAPLELSSGQLIEFTALLRVTKSEDTYRLELADVSV